MFKLNPAITLFIGLLTLLLHGCEIFRIDKELQVSLTISDPKTGQPIEGATVTVRCYQSNHIHGYDMVKEFLFERTTNEHGKFSRKIEFGTPCSYTRTSVSKKDYYSSRKNIEPPLAIYTTAVFMDDEAKGLYYLSPNSGRNLESLQFTCLPGLTSWKEEWMYFLNDDVLNYTVNHGGYGKDESGGEVMISKENHKFVFLFYQYKLLKRQLVSTRKEQEYLDSCFCPAIKEIRPYINDRFLLTVKYDRNVPRKEENEFLKRCGLPYLQLFPISNKYIEDIRSSQDQERLALIREEKNNRSRMQLIDSYLQMYSKLEDRIEQGLRSLSEKEKEAYLREVCAPLNGIRSRVSRLGLTKNTEKKKYFSTISDKLRENCRIAKIFISKAPKLKTKRGPINGKCPEGETLVTRRKIGKTVENLEITTCE